MKAYGYVVTWTTYWLGHAVSKCLYVDSLYWLYGLYNKLMCTSLDYQDKYKVKGPWTAGSGSY